MTITTPFTRRSARKKKTGVRSEPNRARKSNAQLWDDANLTKSLQLSQLRLNPSQKEGVRRVKDITQSRTRKRRLQREGLGRKEICKIDLQLLQRLLHTDLGVEDMPLTSDMSLQTVEKVLLARSLLKKYEGGSGTEAARKAIDAFLERNSMCLSWEPKCDSLIDELVDNEFDLVINKFFYPSADSSFGLAQISCGFNVGPGAAIGSEEGDFLTKVFHSPLCGTHQDLYTFYVHAIGDSTWGEAEKARFRQYGFTVVEGSRLSTVPKNVEEERVICTEPPLNMLFQKGIGAVFEDNLKIVFGIDLSKQPEINRWLARLGSVCGDICTLDLKGASDSVSVRFCEAKLPRLITWWLKLARSPYTILPDGTKVKLGMISSMGNAFTFPLQTGIFASIVKACYNVLGIKTPRCDSEQPSYGVFGDDIIVLKSAYGLVVRTLQRYGFTVNDGKSFSSGSFRESCGGDYWCGYLVRGVYIKNLRHEADVYSAINRLIRWSARSGVALDLTVSYLLSRIRRAKLYVPFQEGDTCGLKVSFEKALPKLRLYSVSTRQPLYQALVESGRSYPVPSAPAVWATKNGSSRDYNGAAILVALVGGYIRDGRISLRKLGDERFQVRWRSVPYWDFVPAAEAKLLRGADWKVCADYYVDLM